jgi:hypothetical protein
MATAKMVNGKALVGYIGDVGVDANGVAIDGAPKRPKDTPTEQQPHALAAASADPLQRLADILEGRKAPAVKRAAEAEEPAGEEVTDELPKIADLDAHLAGLTSVAEVKALQKRDERVSAEAKYKARIAELKASE